MIQTKRHSISRHSGPRKLKKKGRTFSLLVKESITKSDSEGFLNSTNEFFNTSNESDSTRVVDQQKINKTTGTVLNTNLTYTEPLSKTISLILNYGLGINNSSSDRRSYNKSASGAYDDLDLQFSNDFKLDQLSNKGGVSMNYTKDKTSFGFGTNVTAVRFNQSDGYTGNSFKRNFINWNRKPGIPTGSLSKNLCVSVIMATPISRD
jgi:hypothetical protein